MKPNRKSQFTNPSVLLRILIALAWAVVGLGKGEAEDAAKKPNIVVFLADDLNWNLPGFNGGAGMTPNLDRLAREGTSLSQFYVHSVCSPTRAAFLTGRYPFRNGMEQRSHGNDVAGMLPDERTLAESLKAVGYETAIVGKWHLGNWYQRQLPMQRGFDYQYGFYGALISYYYHTRDHFYDWHRNGETIREEGYSTDLFADDFVRTMKERSTEHPFFYYVAFNAIHSPSDAPKELLEKYRKLRDQSSDKGDSRGSADVIRLAKLDSMDTAIGRMMEALRAKGVLENTLVIFFNDNGGVETNPPFRGGKTQTYEGGVRVSCILRWPGHIPEGKSVGGLVHVVDLYPTLLKLAGGSLEQPLPLDGMDMWDVFTGKKPSPRTEVVHSLPGDEVETGPMSICQGQWKLVDKELYDIDTDPGEKTNVAAQHPEIYQRLLARIQQLVPERRPPEKHGRIDVKPLMVFGEKENANPPPWLKGYLDALPPEAPAKGRRKGVDINEL